ncbi:hypothetical protein [Vagococcus jeotgali]|uniref:hypothetical protein n=1 Tax=Vagococcus jeotgali TaxID=3109030 RepID=UPI002DDC4D1F|nr:hypothetical protein [Vagococcus sp. B2T-5]
MIKDKYYYFTNRTKEIKIADLSLEEKIMVENYVEKTRHFVELFRLYKVFRCNLNLMLSDFIIYTNDSILHKRMSLNEEEMYTLINTYTVNLISSGRVLVESIEVYFKKNMKEKDYIDFRKLSSSKVYDEFFSYRFLNLLRNYSGSIINRVDG